MKAVILGLLDLLLKGPMWLYYKSRTTRIFLRARLSSSARVLDIGSGHNPWFRSNVLLDRYTKDDTERCGPIQIGRREFVEGDATDLPFPDKSFDFVYCSHIAEHIEDIGRFFQEIQRVGRAGYIETPNHLWEQMVGTTTHTWALWAEGNVLHSERKWIPGAPAGVYHTMHRLVNSHPSFAFILTLLPEFQMMRFWWKTDFEFELHEAPRPLAATRSVAEKTPDFDSANAS
jgi:SAM-dependent methyltransferase